MRIVLRIGKRMVHAVHYAIGPWAQVRRTLRDIRHDKKELLPGFAHGKRPVRGIAVLKKGLGKKRQVPVEHKGTKNNDQGLMY